MRFFQDSQTANHVATMVFVRCPQCRAEFAVANDPRTATVPCLHCHHEFFMAAGMRLLDWIEYAIRRMVIGLVEFVRWRVPAWFYSVVVGSAVWLVSFLFWLVPLSAKVVRVTGWVCLWLLIPVGPATALGLAATGIARFPHLGGMSFALAATAVFWVAAVVGGYCWAYWHYRGKRRKAASERAGEFTEVGRSQNHELCPAGE